MPILHKCNKELGAAIVVWNGKVTFPQWQENSRQLLSDPDFALTSMQIVDLRFASVDPSIAETEFQEIINHLSLHKHLFAGRRVAVIADEEFGRATVFKHMGESLGTSFIVFNDLLIACHWLGVDVAKVEEEIETLRTKLRQEGKA